MKPERPKTPQARETLLDASKSSAGNPLPFRHKTRGAALTEMGIVVGMISVLAIGAVMTVGEETKESFCTAAGALDKAQGGDGYCLDEATAFADPFAPEGTGYANGAFTDMYWPPRTTGPQLVLLPIEEGTPSPMVMQAGTEENDLEACYRLTPSADLNCAATRIPVPRNAHQVGYRKPLPEDVNAPVDELVQLSFLEGETATKQWTVSLFREQVGPPFNPTFEFSDMVFTAGTTGYQSVMLEKTGTYSEAMEFSVTPTGGRAFAACTQAYSSSDQVCNTLSEATTTSSVSATTYGLGYSIELPGNLAADLSEPITLDLTTPGWAMNARDWNINVSREPMDGDFVTALDFGDVDLPTRATGVRPLISEVLDGTFDEDLVFTSNGRGEIPVSPCYVLKDGDAPVCEPAGSEAVSVTVPADAYSVGYRVTVENQDIFSPYTQQIDLSLASLSMPESPQNWSPTLTRPEDILVFEPTMDFEDVYTLAAGETSHMAVLNIGGTYTDDMIATVTSTDGMPIQMPYTKNGFANYFYAATSYDVPQGFGQRVGYKIDLTGTGVSTWDAMTTEVVFTLTSVHKPEVSKSWVITLERPEKEVVMEPTMAFNDVYTPGAGASSHMAVLSVGGTYNDQMIATATSTDGLPIQLAYTKESFGGYFYADTSYKVPTDFGARVGYKIDLTGSGISTWDAMTTEVIFTLTSVRKPELSKSWVISLERPEKEVVMEPTFAFTPSRTLNAGVKTVGQYKSIQGTRNTYMVATTISPDGFPTKTYYSRSGFGGINMADSVNISTNSKERYGYYVDLSSADIYEPLETEVIFRVTSTVDPEITKEWVIPISRPAKPRFDPQVTFEAQTLASDYADTYDVTFPIDMTGVNIGNVIISAEATGDLNGTWCFDATCGDLASPLATSAEVDALSISELGARIDLRGSGFDAVDGEIIVTMTPVDQPAMAKSWTLDVTRAQQEVSINPSVSFQTVFDLAEGDSSLFDWSQVTGSWNSPMTASVSTSAGFPVQVAYTVPGESSPTLASSAAIPVGSTESYGISADLSEVSIWEAVDEDIVFTIASQIDPSIKKTWTISVTRPAKTPVLEPSVSFANQTVAADFTGTGQVSFPVDMGATNVGDVYLVSRIVSGDAAGGYCYNGSCEGLEVTEAQSGPIDAQSISTVGVQWDFSEVPAGYQKTVLLVAMHSVEFPEMNTAWALSVERPAE